MKPFDHEMKSPASRTWSLRQHGRRWALIALAVISILGFAQAYAEEAAPRRIDDVLQVLDHYKPDPEIARRARRGADQQPPDAVFHYVRDSKHVIIHPQRRDKTQPAPRSK